MRASTNIEASKYPLEAAMQEPTIIPDTESGKVRRRAAFIHDSKRANRNSLVTASPDPFLAAQLECFINVHRISKGFGNYKAVFEAHPAQVVTQGN